MKTLKKLGSVLVAALMMAAMAVPALAAETGTITINNATAGNTYKVYKVFDAEGNDNSISYKLVETKESAPAGFVVDDAGNVIHGTKNEDGTITESSSTDLSSEEIAAIAAYVTEADLVDTVTIADEATSGTTKALPNGYYYITTTTGTAVTITSTNPNATVTDKNEAPDLNKKITGVSDGSLDADGKKALAEVGTTVTYTATIDVKNGAENYVFHDAMSAGLSYNADSLTVKVGGETIEAGADTYSTATATGDTLTITFVDSWIETQVGNTITIIYSATVTSDALTTDESAATNSATIDYGHNAETTNSTIPSTTKVYNAKFTVTKKDDKNQPLAGAGFVIAKTVEGETLYYQLTTEENGDKDVSWVDDINEATEYTSNDNGAVSSFTGLADGTYTLIEKTVPAGYNKAADKTFTITAGNYASTNLEQSATVVNKAGTALPSTGGMGTTLFYAAGAILVVGAGVVLITRKRMNHEQ